MGAPNAYGAVQYAYGKPVRVYSYGQNTQQNSEFLEGEFNQLIQNLQDGC